MIKKEVLYLIERSELFPYSFGCSGQVYVQDSDTPKLQLEVRHLLAVWSWALFATTIGLVFPIHKMELIIIPASKYCCEDDITPLT